MCKIKVNKYQIYCNFFVAKNGKKIIMIIKIRVATFGAKKFVYDAQQKNFSAEKMCSKSISISNIDIN